ncbi:unnamed protein product, partial [Chrysoparadoxa australica]
MQSQDVSEVPRQGQCQDVHVAPNQAQDGRSHEDAQELQAWLSQSDKSLEQYCQALRNAGYHSVGSLLGLKLEAVLQLPGMRRGHAKLLMTHVRH